jgi:hypothetical protein
MEHLFATRVAEIGVQRMFEMVQQSAQMHNDVMLGLLSVLSERTTLAQVQVELPGDGTLQPLDEYGNPLPVAPSGSYQVGFPIQGGGTAWGNNRVSRALMTVEEANRNTWDATQRDADWMTRHALAAIFDNTSWTYNDKVGPNGAKGLGDITIQPLANSDTVVYMRRGGQATAVDNHYLAQAADISDSANPFPTIRTELIEHPSNSAPFVTYVPSGLVDDIGNLTEFVEINDPDINYGLSSDTLLVNPNLEAILGPGDEILGKTKSSNIWIVEWDFLPAGYMIAQALGGTGGPTLMMREYDAASLQGFFPESHSPDGNLQEMRMIRFAGFGAYNRIRALAYYVGDASYAVPSGYTSPLAI